MRKVILFSMLLVLGLLASQLLPTWVPTGYAQALPWLRKLTLVGLAFIMVRVGNGFMLEKCALKECARDYLVAFSAAGLPWILVSLYFIFVLLPAESWGGKAAWEECLLAGRFAAPTSAGVLFSMLSAAGLGATWLFRKARVLAVLDDLDTVILLVPLQMLMAGFSWGLWGLLGIVVVLIGAAYKGMHRLAWSMDWHWVLLYAVLIVVLCTVSPVHVEVLLPAFVLGCVIVRPDPLVVTASGKWAVNGVSALFMLLVGLSMPPVIGVDVPMVFRESGRITMAQPALGWGLIVIHVLAITALSNLGKMVVVFWYGREATLRERLALGIGMWPRGEVGAGVVAISVSYGIGGPVVTVAVLCLALNLLLTGGFIVVVKKLLGNTGAI